jgi:hypothetical protein
MAVENFSTFLAMEAEDEGKPAILLKYFNAYKTYSYSLARLSVTKSNQTNLKLKPKYKTIHSSCLCNPDKMSACSS